MAEIGLAASIISVAAFGASVAKTLYDTADVVKNADQQLRALAKHVTQFTAVLNHMGQVLKTEKTNCSKEVLRDIRKIKHSCKRTFREIRSTVKSKRFRRLVWFFKRTKAMELEARLDSQQSMLQCMIHTLTVSKLSKMDSRSKEDSEHITGLKVEITLLKTFIKESYNNLMALRRAEQSREADAGYQPKSRDGSYPMVHHPFVDDSNFPSDPTGISNAFEPPLNRSPSPTSNPSKSDTEDSSSDDERNDSDNDGTNSINFRDQNDHEGPRPKDDTSDARRLIQPRMSYEDSSAASVHRESNLLLQMVPYRPGGPDPIRSDRLISGGQGLDSGTRTTTEEATDSVRLLLEKWTTSGSAPISNLLDEEAAKEKNEAELANKRRASDPQYGAHRWSSSPGAKHGEYYVDPTPDPGEYDYARPFNYDQMPSSPPLYNPQPSYKNITSTARDFWGPSDRFSQSPDRQLGNEILTALRSTRGGIHYVKSNQFRRVHYVDRYPIYTCALVPSHMVPYNEDKLQITELGKGSIRREALDLLTYSYTETDTGNFLISDNLELGEIEELVKLSYQALDRILEKQSKAVIKERGWGTAIGAMNRGMPGMRSNEPWTASQYFPPRPGPWDPSIPLNDEHYRHHPYPEYKEYKELVPYGSAPAQTAVPRLHSRERPSGMQRVRPIFTTPPIEGEAQEQDGRKITRPEVRFTLPRAQLVSDTIHTTKETPPSTAKSDVSTRKTDDELKTVLQRLERVQIRKEEAEKRKDIAIAADLTYHVIPDLEPQVEKLRKQQREEQEKIPAPISQNEEDKKSRHTEVETESEESDEEEGGPEADLYE